MCLLVETAKAVQAPQRLDGASAASRNAHFERGRRALLAAVDQQPLRRLTPEQIIAVHRRHQLRVARAGQRFDLRLRCLVPHHAVDPPVATIAVRVDVCVALAELCVVACARFARCRVVLDNEVVPVRDPQVAVRTDLRRHRREPLVGRGQERIAVLRLVARASAGKVIFPEQMPGRTANERHFVAQRLREPRRGRHRLTRASRIVIESVDLTDIWCDRVERAIGGNHSRTHALLATPVGGGGDAAEEAGVVVGGRAKDVARRVKTEAPSIVVELVHEFQLRTVRLDTEHAGTKAQFLAAHFTSEA